MSKFILYIVQHPYTNMEDFSTMFQRFSRYTKPMHRGYVALGEFKSEMETLFKPDKTIHFNFKDNQLVLKDESSDYSDVIVTCREDSEFSDEEKQHIFLLLNNALDEIFIESLKDDEFIKLMTPIEAPLVQEHENKYYDFDSAYNEKMDWLIASIKRPHTEKPFTMIVREFKVMGYEPIFYFIWNDSEWGSFVQDYEFMKLLWSKLMGDDKPYSLDYLVQKQKEYNVHGIPIQVFRKTLREMLVETVEDDEME